MAGAIRLTFWRKAPSALLGCMPIIIPLLAFGQSNGSGGVSGGPIPSTERPPPPSPAPLQTSRPQLRMQKPDSFWTQERLDAASPMTVHPQSLDSNGVPAGGTLRSGSRSTVNPPANPSASPLRIESSKPTISVKPDLTRKRAVVPTPAQQHQGLATPQSSQVSPGASGSTGANFITSRVFPDEAAVDFPYRAAGKLWFTDRGVNPPKTYNCSASVVNWRIVITAGHCVAHGDTNSANRYPYSDFLFIPAYNNGARPYGAWTASSQWVTNAWYYSGSVPNEQDVGMLVMNDQQINGGIRRIGEVTGHLGLWILSLSGNEVTMIGYPANLDAGQRMQYSTAQAFADGGSNTVIYGTAMSHGESGGPWIEDFGVAPVWTPGVNDPSIPLGTNLIVGVASYVPCAENVACPPKWFGASILDARAVDLYNTACGTDSKNCK